MNESSNICLIMSNDENVIVTGVAGFIGSHLAEKLLDTNHKVIGIDCFTDYYSKEIKQHNLVNCKKHGDFTLIDGNLLEMDLLPIFKKSKVLIHVAAQSGVRNSWGENFKIYVKNNIIATQRILETAKETQSFDKIVLASSSSVYGNQNGTMKEELVPKPISPYGVTKLAAENLGMIFSASFKLPIITLRYFSVYGPRQRPDMAFTKFIKTALTSGNTRIFGDGTQMRDFTFISDVVTATISASKSKTHGEIFNIGGGHVNSIRKVFEIIENITCTKIEKKFLPKQEGDVFRTEAGIEKASKILGYNPEISLEVGLRKQIDYMKNNLFLYN